MQGEAAAAISTVLDNDDLLGEILLRLAFPTSLVRAALVCRRWLRLASAPAFLRHFRDLHPPSLLGFYVTTHKNTRFVPMPQPAELSAVVHCASFDLDTMDSARLDVECWNGLVLTTLREYHGWRTSYTRRVRCPLYPARYLSILPPPPETSIHIHDGFTYHSCEILPNGGGRDGMSSFFYMEIGCKGQQSVFDVYVLQEDNWAIYSSVVCEFFELMVALPNSLIVDDDKIYNLVRESGAFKLLSLDLSSSCLSLVNLPEEEMKLLHIDLSLANDSKVHLIHVKGSQLRVWLLIAENNNGLHANCWSLVNTVCLHEICANHMIPTSIFEDSGLMVTAVRVISGFFFLEMNDVLYFFDIKRKTAKKVFEVTQEDRYLHRVIPFMMVWPPKFPVMKEGCDPKE